MMFFVIFKGNSNLFDFVVEFLRLSVVQKFILKTSILQKGKIYLFK